MVTPSAAAPEPRTYGMRISRLTIDKLGVKLYDRASAVVAELTHNSHDADATEVTGSAPLVTELARSMDNGDVVERGWLIAADGIPSLMRPLGAIEVPVSEKVPSVGLS